MGFSWGAALNNVGSSLPTVGKTYDDMLKQKKQEVLDKITLDDLIDKMNMQGEARKKFGEYQADKNFVENSNAFVGPPSLEDKKKYDILSSLTPDQMQEKYNLPFLSAYEPGVKSAIDNDKKGGPSGLFAGWTERNRQKDDILRGINPYGVNAGKPFKSEEEKIAANKEWRERWNTAGELAISPEYIEGSANKAAAAQKAQIPGKAVEAAATEQARGSAEAKTPQFIAARKKEWDNTLASYNEAYQQYSLGRNAPDNATGDVALVNSLEKVREINSAVMYGDYQKWQQANNLLSSMEQDGILGAIRKGALKRLPPTVRADMEKLLDGLFANRQTLIDNAKTSAINLAKEDYGWDDRRANLVYRSPKLGFDVGFKPTSQDANIKAAYPGAPAVGTVKNGYIFNGGNPNDKNNWTKQ